MTMGCEAIVVAGSPPVGEYRAADAEARPRWKPWTNTFTNGRAIIAAHNVARIAAPTTPATSHNVFLFDSGGVGVIGRLENRAIPFLPGGVAKQSRRHSSVIREPLNSALSRKSTANAEAQMRVVAESSKRLCQPAPFLTPLPRAPSRCCSAAQCREIAEASCP